MPFSIETASAAGRKGGKKRAADMWQGKDPATVRNVRVGITLSRRELDAIDASAEAAGLSRTEFIVRACEAF